MEHREDCDGNCHTPEQKEIMDAADDLDLIAWSDEQERPELTERGWLMGSYLSFVARWQADAEAVAAA